MSGVIDDWDTPSVAQPTNHDSDIRSQTFSNSDRPGRGRGRGGGGGGFRGRGGADRGGDRRDDFGGGGRRDDFGGGGRRDDFGGGGRRDNFGGSWRNNGGGGRDDYGGGSRNDYGGGRRDDFTRRDDRNDGNWRSRDQDRGRRDDNRNGGGGEPEIMMVPSRLIGKVIGRGGSKISDLQFESSAKIQVTKETDGDDTVIKIFGSPEEISKAKELIEMTIEEKPKPEPVKMVDYSTAPKNDNFYQAENPWAPPNVDGPKINWREMLEASEAAAEAEWAKIPPIIKYFYQEHPDVTALTEEQVAEIRENNNNIVVNRTFETENSKPIPKPVVAFEHAFFNYPEIMEEIRKQGFERPSPIQCQAWPVLLTGEDLIGIAQTGTGKTLAFLLPALIHIEGQAVPRSERFGPTVIVMAPTRELALQIDKEVKKYQYRNIKSVCVYGGGDRKAQVEVVTSGVDIVIATPGRMNDLYSAGHLNIKSISYVVLDEADRMLDMGFEPQIRKVMYSLRPTRQCIMTSATWPPGVRALAKSYMTDPIQVYVGSLDLAATHTVTQTIQMINEDEKESLFYDFVENLGPDDKIIVFCGSKAKADYLSVELSLKGILCAALHGNRDQSDREQAVQDIGDGTVKILIATDVASRGLDINDITHVLNYDFPRNIEEYVHRVGRTGRAGKSGQSISFFSRKDWTQARELIKILEEAGQYVPEDLVEMAERWEAKKEQDDRAGFSGRGGGRGRGGRGRRDDFAFTGEIRIGGGRGGGRRDKW